MADYYRTGTAVTSLQDVIDEILAFTTAAAPGPGWAEDATYPAAANPGELFLETSGATAFYIYFNDITIGAVTVLQCYRVPGAANGFGGAAGPTNHFTAPGACVYLDTVNYTYVQHSFASEDRAIIAIKGTLLEAMGHDITLPAETYQLLYFGGYTPHAAAADDPYPNIVLSNGALAAGLAPSSETEGYFPLCLAKMIGWSGAADLYRFACYIGVGWNVLHGRTVVLPRNSRGTESFAYQQDVHVFYPGAEESFSLTGMYVSTKDHGLEQDVTIGIATYYSLPTLLTAHEISPTTEPNVYLVPKGTVVP